MALRNEGYVEQSERPAIIEHVSEEWRAVVDYEGYYEVSDQGGVRSLDRLVAGGRYPGGTRPMKGVILQGEITWAGYRRVSLTVDRVVSKRTVHSLVAEAFIGPRPEGLQVCHNDGNSQNNHPSNLRYDTASANVRDSVEHGTQGEARKTHCSQGHPYDEANTTWVRTPSGKGRQCLTCKRLRERSRRAAARLAA